MGEPPFFYFKMVIFELGVRTGERSRERKRIHQRERGVRETLRVRVWERENTREESRLIYFICRERQNLKSRMKKVGDSEKESVGCCFHEQAA